MKKRSFNSMMMDKNNDASLMHKIKKAKQEANEQTAVVDGKCPVCWENVPHRMLIWTRCGHGTCIDCLHRMFAKDVECLGQPKDDYAYQSKYDMVFRKPQGCPLCRTAPSSVFSIRQAVAVPMQVAENHPTKDAVPNPNDEAANEKKEMDDQNAECYSCVALRDDPAKLLCHQLQNCPNFFHVRCPLPNCQQLVPYASSTGATACQFLVSFSSHVENGCQAFVQCPKCPTLVRMCESKQHVCVSSSS
jgi:hypothetical protein